MAEVIATPRGANYPLVAFTYRAFDIEERHDMNGKKQFVVRCMKAGKEHELAPTFDNLITAKEIARKATENAEFFNRIPAVPLGSPIPRDPSKVFNPGRGETGK